MKLSKSNYACKNKKNKYNNIIPIKSRNENEVTNKENNHKDSWINKKINLNFFENKNLIKELRAKYLPDNEINNNSEPILNNMNNIYKKEFNDSNKDKNEDLFDNNSKQCFSSIQNEDNSFGQLNESDLKDSKNDQNEKELFNIKEKSKDNTKFKNNIRKTSKSSKQKNIIIENRFYTEIINSNILLDKNLILNSLNEENSSLYNKNKDKEIQINNYRNNIDINFEKNTNDAMTRNDNNNDNQFISLSLKNMKLDSINQNKGESSPNNEMNYLKNKEIFENIFNVKKFQGNNNLEEQINNKNKENLKKENEQMKKELKNYEKLITPLINYINDINRILDQKEINPSDIGRIIKNYNSSESSFYINNLISNLNNSKDEIAFKLDKNNKKILPHRKRNKRRINNLKLYNLKGRRITRSAEDIKHWRFINSRISFDKYEKGNYFYEDASDKYIFDYYKDRNINCSACLLGNNISQRGYSPKICCHLGDYKDEYDKNNENSKESVN